MGRGAEPHHQRLVVRTQLRGSALLQALQTQAPGRWLRPTHQAGTSGSGPGHAALGSQGTELRLGLGLDLLLVNLMVNLRWLVRSEVNWI